MCINISKGVFALKKVFLAVLSAIVVMSTFVESFAAVINTTIKSDKETVDFSFNSTTFTEYKADLMPVIGEWEIPGENDYISRDVSINFATDGEGESALYLRLEGDTADVVNFFKFRFVSKNGEVLYDDMTKSNPATENFREIYITDSKTPMEFKLEYRVAPGADRGLDISSLKLKAASKVDATTPVATKKPVPTQKPKFDLDSLDNGRQEIVFDISDGTIKGPDNKPEEKSVVKTVGVDIPADRYAVKGNGKLTVTTSNGMVKYESVITDATGTAVVLLEKGDVIRITSANGGDTAKLSFSKAATDNQVPATVTGAPDKTNPKTDDSSMGVVMTLGIVTLIGAAIAGLEILKRKKNGNN